MQMKSHQPQSYAMTRAPRISYYAKSGTKVRICPKSIPGSYSTKFSLGIHGGPQL